MLWKNPISVNKLTKHIYIYIYIYIYAGQSKTEGVVTGWMEVKQTNANSVEDILVTRAKCNEEPRTVRAETGLH